MKSVYYVAAFVCFTVILGVLQFSRAQESVEAPQFINRDPIMFWPGSHQRIGKLHVLLTIPYHITIGSDAQAEIRIAPREVRPRYTVGANATATLLATDLRSKSVFEPPAPYILPWVLALSAQTRGNKLLHYKINLPLEDTKTGKKSTWKYTSFESFVIIAREDLWGQLALIASGLAIVGVLCSLLGVIVTLRSPRQAAVSA